MNNLQVYDKYNMTQFTKKELQEIEKSFDILIAMHLNKSSKLLTSISQIKGTEDIITKLLDEFVSTFDAYRMISTKSNVMQGEVE